MPLISPGVKMTSGEKGCSDLALDLGMDLDLLLRSRSALMAVDSHRFRRDEGHAVVLDGMCRLVDTVGNSPRPWE